MTVRIKNLAPMYRYMDDVEDKVGCLGEFSDMLLLDELSEERIERSTKLLSETLEIPVAFTTLAIGERSWSHCSSGVRFTDIERDFCLNAQAFGSEGVLTVTNPSSDPRFEHHPAVNCPFGVKFFAGAALIGPNGNVVGTCSVIDYRRRSLTRSQLKFLRQTIKMIEREMQSQEIVVELRENMKGRVLRDPATDLPNMSLFNESLDRCLDCKKKEASQCVVATIRLARYDMLENAIGRFGTAYIIGIAVERIRRRMGSDILIGQIREDELIVSRSYSTNLTHHTELLGSIVDCFSEPFCLGDETFRIAVEIGASRYPADARHSAELIRKARIALRSTETSDKSGYRLYKHSLAAQSDEEFRLESALTRGLSRGEFFVVYQPIVSLSTNRITGAEALMRWTSQEMGVVPPGVFIPIAERIGLLSEIGNFAASTVCRHLSEWRSLGLEQLNISINLSGSQLHDPEFSERIVQLIDEHDIDGSQLTLEITEGSLIENPEQAIQIMNSLRTKSISFSIDDFGTGFSSLNYLRMMPLSVLKIDRSFVANIPDSHNDLSIAQSVIALGHSLGLKVVAEGVENSRQLEWLRDQKCDEVQGYIFSKPLRVEKFEELIHQDPVFQIEDRRIRVV